MRAPFAERLRAREVVLGTMLFEYARATVVERLLPLGLDFIAVDTEHASLSRAEVGQLVSAVRLAGMAALVRVLRPRAHEVAAALDAGAHGVLVPYVETPAEVREVVGAARLRPLKGSHLARFIRTGSFPSGALGAAARQRNANAAVVIGIESIAAVRALPRLLRAAPVDGVFVGVWDLTATLGVPGEITHPRARDAFRRVLDTCAAAGIAAGIWPLPAAEARRWLEGGMTLGLFSSDLEALVGGLRAQLEVLRPPAAPPPAAPRRRRVRARHSVE